MTRRSKIRSLGAALALALGLQQSCTDNQPSRLLESRVSKDAGTSGSAGRPPTSGGSGPNTGGSSSGGTGGSDGGEGGAGVDECLQLPCDGGTDCAGDPLWQAAVDFCRLYARHCPDQPEDVMTELGPGEQIPAGPASTSTATRPQLNQAEADANYTIAKALSGGGVYEASYSGDGGAGGEGSRPLGERTVTYENPAWDPRGPIEDVNKIVPGIIVDPDGDPENDEDRIFTTIQAAITQAVNIAGCPRVFIKVLPGTYREKITVPAKTSTPPVTLYGVDKDPSSVVIVAGHSSAGAENDGTPLTVHQSATFTNSLPQPFQARNLTIQNDYIAGTYLPDEPEKQTAVALLSQADRALFENVRILGHFNALYVKSTAANEVSRVYFRNCYLEGDQDMILGRGAAVFDQCRIHSLGDRISGGSITAPSTRVDNPHGILIINSRLTADAGVSDVYLGHPWFEGDVDEAVGKTIIRNSILGAHVRPGNVWAPSLRTTPQNPTPTSIVLYTSDDYYAPATGLIPPEIFLAEFGNSGPGAAQ